MWIFLLYGELIYYDIHSNTLKRRGAPDSNLAPCWPGRLVCSPAEPGFLWGPGRHERGWVSGEEAAVPWHCIQSLYRAHTEQREGHQSAPSGCTVTTRSLSHNNKVQVGSHHLHLSVRAPAAFLQCVRCSGVSHSSSVLLSCRLENSIKVSLFLTSASWPCKQKYLAFSSRLTHIYWILSPLFLMLESHDHCLSC